MDIEEWALENAGAVVRDAERHGVDLTWSEAHEQLHRIAVLLQSPMYVDDGEDLRRLDPVDETPAWKRPGVAEEVACGLVHAAGRPFFPRDPETSHTPVAVPVARLNFLLTVRLRSISTLVALGPAAELATLLLNLTSDIASELSDISDEEDTATADRDPKIHGHRCLLMRSCHLWQASKHLGEAAELMRDAHPAATRAISPWLIPYLTDETELHTLLWDRLVDQRRRSCARPCVEQTGSQRRPLDLLDLLRGSLSDPGGESLLSRT